LVEQVLKYLLISDIPNGQIMCFTP
jgi:hypothetical protein